MIPVIIAMAAKAIKDQADARKADRVQNGSNSAPSSASSIVGDLALNALDSGSSSLADKANSVNSGSTSDKRLKDILGENAPVDAFAKINAYLFKYKPEAVEMYGNDRGVDEKEHVGVIAQELAENPVTAAAVEEDENGFLEIDTDKLCTALAAVCADLSKRVLALEEALAEKTTEA